MFILIRKDDIISYIFTPEEKKEFIEEYKNRLRPSFNFMDIAMVDGVNREYRLKPGDNPDDVISNPKDYTTEYNSDINENYRELLIEDTMRFFRNV